MPDPRPIKFNLINPNAIPAVSTLAPENQFKVLVNEFIEHSPCKRILLRTALIDWMRTSLSSLDSEFRPTPQPADVDEAKRVYWRDYYALHREQLLARRRERYGQRQRQQFGIQ